MAAFRNDLREGPTSSGRPSAASDSRPASTSKLCSARLANPTPGIENDALGRDPRGNRRAETFAELAPDLGDSVLVTGVAVHVARAPAVVHQDHRGARLGDDVRQGRIIP